MKNVFILILVMHSTSAFSQKMTDYWKVKNSHKMKFYYWDSYKSFPENHPVNVSKEYVYHLTLSNDSILEREMSYSNKNHLVEIKKFAIPSKGELIETDSLFYHINGNLILEKQFSQGYYGKTDTIIITHTYDSLNREISKTTSERLGPDKWITSYEPGTNGQSIKKTIELWETQDHSESIYFLNKTGLVDSIQIFNNGRWVQTTQIERDSATRTEYTYFRYNNHRALRSKVISNEDGFAVDALINEFVNWNETRLYNVEIKKSYTKEGAIQKCDYFIRGKKRYSKIHRFLLQN